MVGGLENKKQQFNLAWQARRQAGSAMKPFVLTAAVEQGMDPTPPTTSPTTRRSSHGPRRGTVVVDGEAWGRSSVAKATSVSDNTVFAQLCVDVGPTNTVAMAHKMGITSPLVAVPSITLGTSGVIAARDGRRLRDPGRGGIHHPPQAIVKVVLPGRARWTGAQDIRQPRHPRRRRLRGHQVLESVAASGTAATVRSYFPYPRAGKTGTTENSWDVWYVGYTPQLAAAVWMGDPVE